MIISKKENIEDNNNVHCKPDVTVAVCTYNRAEYLRITLQSLVVQTCGGRFSYEIIVVDNGSTDNTKDIVEEISRNSPVPVRYVMERAPGLANARNKGIIGAQGDWIVCFDDDQLAEPCWLKELLEVAWEKSCNCVGGKRLLYLSEEEASNIGPECRKILGEHDRGSVIRKYSGSIRDYPCDANIIRSRKVFEAVPEFSSSWTRGGQDQDFSRRVHEAGYDMWYAPKAIVYHLVPQHKLTTQYFKWTSLRWGTTYAYRDHIRCGRSGMLLLCLARIAQMLLVNIPYLFLCYISHNKAELIDRKCLIIRCVGYIRQCLFLIAPKIFPQNRFFESLDFRQARIG